MRPRSTARIFDPRRLTPFVVRSEPSVPHSLLTTFGGRMTWNSSDRRSRLPSDWESVRKRILGRDNRSCQLRLLGCIGTASEADHIVPNDDHSDENLRAACRSCHSKKSSAEGNNRQRQLRALRKRPTERHPGRR